MYLELDSQENKSIFLFIVFLHLGGRGDIYKQEAQSRKPYPSEMPWKIMSQHLVDAGCMTQLLEQKVTSPGLRAM